MRAVRCINIKQTDADGTNSRSAETIFEYSWNIFGFSYCWRAYTSRKETLYCYISYDYLVLLRLNTSSEVRLYRTSIWFSICYAINILFRYICYVVLKNFILFYPSSYFRISYGIFEYFIICLLKCSTYLNNIIIPKRKKLKKRLNIRSSFLHDN